MKIKLPVGTLDKLWGDPKSWKSPLIYHCEDDPRIIVPKRNKWAGWTMNFAHTSAWVFLASIVGLITIATYFIVNAGLLYSWAWYATVTGLIVMVIGLCRILASPRRHEEKS